jgi:hypothetical protein
MDSEPTDIPTPTEDDGLLQRFLDLLDDFLNNSAPHEEEQHASNLFRKV